MLEVAQNGIVFQEMGQGGRAGQVIDRYELKVAIIDGGAQHVASNTDKDINDYFYCHLLNFPPKSENLDLDAERRRNGKTAQHLQNGLQIRVAEVWGGRKLRHAQNHSPLRAQWKITQALRSWFPCLPRLRLVCYT